MVTTINWQDLAAAAAVAGSSEVVIRRLGSENGGLGLVQRATLSQIVALASGLDQSQVDGRINAVVTLARITAILEAATGDNRLQYSALRGVPSIPGNTDIDGRIASWARANGATGTVPEASLPSSIARDSEVTAAVTDLRNGVDAAYDTLAELAAGLPSALTVNAVSRVLTMSRGGSLTALTVTLPGGGALTVGTTAPTGGADGDAYVRTGATSPGLYVRSGGTWTNVLAPGGGSLTGTRIVSLLAALVDDNRLSYSSLRQRPTLGTAAAVDTGTGSGNVPVLDSGGKLADGVIPTGITRDTELDARISAAAVGRIPSASPGNSKVWKTDMAGTPGWRDDAAGTGSGGGASSFSELTGQIADSQIPSTIARDSELPDVSGLATTASLATVATSGAYGDLSGTPTIPTLPTDAQIGDKAFSNPPSDLTDDEKTAARTAIGAGTGDGGGGDSSATGVPEQSYRSTLADVTSVASTWTKLALGAADIDEGDFTVASDTVAPTVAGRYLVIGHAQGETDNSGSSSNARVELELRFSVDDTPRESETGNYARNLGGNYTALNDEIVELLDLQAGSVVELQGRVLKQVSGDTCTIDGSASFLALVRLGAGVASASSGGGDGSGPSITRGTAAPSNSDGADGDLYIRTVATGSYGFIAYIKESGAWEQAAFGNPKVDAIVSALGLDVVAASNRGQLIGRSATDETFNWIDLPAAGVSASAVERHVGGTYRRWSGGTLAGGAHHELELDTNSLADFDDILDGAALYATCSIHVDGESGDASGTLTLTHDTQVETIAVPPDTPHTLRLRLARNAAGGYSGHTVTARVTAGADGVRVSGMRLDLWGDVRGRELWPGSVEASDLDSDLAARILPAGGSDGQFLRRTSGAPAWGAAPAGNGGGGGTTWHRGTDEPDLSIGEEGHYYLRSGASAVVYVRTDTRWVRLLDLGPIRHLLAEHDSRLDAIGGLVATIGAFADATDEEYNLGFRFLIAADVRTHAGWAVDVREETFDAAISSQQVAIAVPAGTDTARVRVRLTLGGSHTFLVSTAMQHWEPYSPTTGVVGALDFYFLAQDADDVPVSFSSEAGTVAVIQVAPETQQFELDLADLAQGGATDGQAPLWDDTAGEWVPGTIAAGGGGGGGAGLTTMRKRFFSGPDANAEAMDSDDYDLQSSSIVRVDAVGNIDDEGNESHLTTAADIRPDALYVLVIYETDSSPREYATHIFTGAYFLDKLYSRTIEASNTAARTTAATTDILIDTAIGQDLAGFQGGGRAVYFARITASGTDADDDRIGVRASNNNVAFHVFELEIAGAGGGQAGEPLTSQEVGAAIRHYGWAGHSDPDEIDGLAFEILSGASGVGYRAADGTVRLGNATSNRGVLVYTDAAGVVDPEDCFLQAAIGWDDGAQWSFFFGLGVDDPEADTSQDVRNRFSAGIVVQFATSVHGQMDMRILYPEDDSERYPPSDALTWSYNADLGVGQPSSTEISDDRQRNATLRATLDRLLGAHAETPKQVGIEVFVPHVAIYVDGEWLATARYSAATWPFRAGQPRGTRYEIRSSSGALASSGGALRSPQQNVFAAGLTPARLGAPHHGLVD